MRLRASRPGDGGDVVMRAPSGCATKLGRLGLPGQSLDLKALRHRFISLPGRIVSSERKPCLRLPCNWPWQDNFEEALHRLRQLEMASPLLA